MKNDFGRNMTVNPVLLSPLYSGRTNLTSSNTFYKPNSSYTPTGTVLDQQLQKFRLDYDYPLPIDSEFQKLPYNAYPYSSSASPLSTTRNLGPHLLAPLDWINESDDQKDPIHFNYKQIIHDLKSENNDQDLVKLIQALRLVYYLYYHHYHYHYYYYYYYLFIY